MRQWHLNRKIHAKEAFSQNHGPEEIWEGSWALSLQTSELVIRVFLLQTASFPKTIKISICDVYSKLPSIYWKIVSFTESKAFAAVMYFILSSSLQ